MATITRDEVFFLLEPQIGLPLLMANPALASDLVQCLESYFYLPITLDEQCAKVKSALFNGVYEATRGTMVGMDVQGQPKKIYSEQFSPMAELLMAPIFERLPVGQAAFDALNDYALRHTSLSACKRLYVDFRDYLPDMNLSIIRRVVTENFPPEAYAGWLEATQ